MKLLFTSLIITSSTVCSKQLRYLLLVCLQAFYSLSFSQKHDIKFEHLEHNLGLSNSVVSAILQDSRGFMWFATFDGLNKYDGYRFTIFKNDPTDGNSLSSNSSKSIIEDKKEVIWIGTWGGGVNKFDREKNIFIHFKHNPADANSISSDFITCMLEDKEGNLWIGTGSGGLDRLDRKNGQFIHYTLPGASMGLGKAYITTIFEDSQQNLWIGTINQGLHLFNKTSKTFERLLHSDKDGYSIGDNDVNVIFEDSRKDLWIGTNMGGLDKFNKKTGEFDHYKKSIFSGGGFVDYDVLSIAEDNDKNFWIGTRNGGLYIFNPQTGVSHNYRHDELDITSLSRNIVPGIYKDRKGDIWISTLAAGLNFVNTSGKDFIHYKHNSSIYSLSDNNVTSIYEDADKNLWIGTDGAGLNLFDDKLGRFIHHRHQANNKNTICGDNILSIGGDSKGNLWIGTWANGITVFNRKKNTFKHYKNDPANPASLGNNNVWAIYEDKEKNIWIGTYGGGLNLYNPANESFTRYEYDEKNQSGINNNQVISIFEDSKGFLWLGTDGGGLNQFDKKTKKFTHFIHDDSSNSLSYNFVSDIFEDKKGNLYFATGTGLNYFDTKTHHFTLYYTNDDAKNETVCGILEDASGNLWISRAKGISRFNPASKSFINFNADDGLNNNNYGSTAYCKSSTGAMYFGGVNGFDKFFPDSIKKMSFDPRTVITDFQVFNKKVPIAKNENDPSPLKKDITETKKITIPYSSSVISFEFASLRFGAEVKKQYAYMLEGFDKGWNEVSKQHTATYTNLDPGQYTFKVKGLNNEGKWSSNIVNLHLTITPPFWLTWWFKLAISLSVAGSMIAFYLLRINTVKTQKAKLEQQVHEQTLQLVLSTKEAENARIETEFVNKELIEKNKETEDAHLKTDAVNKELLIKNRELEQFVYVASHDLQEPLRTTSGFVELLQQQYRGKLDEKADKYLDFISEASDRMRVLISDLLDISRIGKKGELKKVDCNFILKDMLADIMVAVLETRANIQYSEMPVINGYPTEIKLMFQNLVINAIKFRKKDVPPQIKISAQRVEECWEFAITDNGIGIETKSQERIFDIFQRLHTRKEYAGSGIGLAHCKKIVELHHGKIWVVSSPGEGSVFYFTIPEKIFDKRKVESHYGS